MTPVHLFALLALAAIWGASYLFMWVAVPAFGALVLIELRVLIAGLIFSAGAFLYRRRVTWLPRWRQYLILAGLNAALPFTLIASSSWAIPASLAAILNATTPLFTAVISAVWLKQRLERKLILGLLVAFSGVVLSVGWSPVDISLLPVLASAGVVLAAFLYGLGTNYSSRVFGGVDPVTMTIGQSLGAAVILFPFALATWPTTTPSPWAIAAMLGLALLSTAVAYFIYFWLLNQVGPTRTMSVTFLMPLFGLLWGYLFLGEALTPGMFAGLALVFLGIFLVADLQRPIPSSDSTDISPT